MVYVVLLQSTPSHLPRLWPWRLAMALLIAMLASMVLLAAFAVWVVHATVPVTVVDANDKPVPGVILFDLETAVSARPKGYSFWDQGIEVTSNGDSPPQGARHRVMS